MPSNLIKFAKGLITPESLTVSGSLTPKQSKTIVSAIKKNNKFLSKVNYVTMNSLQRFVDAYDIAEGVLVRVAEGTEPTDEQKQAYANLGCTLNALKVQLFADVTRSALEDNADNPKLENFLFDGFTTRFGNELVKLGFEGVGDTGADFAHLNTGWLQVATDSADVPKDTYTAETEGQVDRLTKLVAKLDADAKGPSTSLLMSWADWEAYILELGGDNQAAMIIAEGKTKTFMGYPVEVSKYMPAGTYFATPLNNLAFGISTAVYRGREWNARKRCLEYTFDLGCDYEIVIKKWAALVTEA